MVSLPPCNEFKKSVYFCDLITEGIPVHMLYTMVDAKNCYEHYANLTKGKNRYLDFETENYSSVLTEIMEGTYTKK